MFDSVVNMECTYVIGRRRRQSTIGKSPTSEYDNLSIPDLPVHTQFRSNIWSSLEIYNHIYCFVYVRVFMVHFKNHTHVQGKNRLWKITHMHT